MASRFMPADTGGWEHGGELRTSGARLARLVTLSARLSAAQGAGAAGLEAELLGLSSCCWWVGCARAGLRTGLLGKLLLS